jgi:hypothetical protein
MGNWQNDFIEEAVQDLLKTYKEEVDEKRL